MIRLFLYECRRLLWNRFFLGLGLLLLFCGWQVLNRATIFGVARTAPFSPWSFGDYLSRMLPFLWIGVLLLLSAYVTPQARRTAVLTDAAPMPPWQYAAVRCAAVSAGAGLFLSCCLGEAALFYQLCFGWHDWETLLAPALITLPPPLIFALGAGWRLSRIHPWLTYVWMAAPAVWTIVPLPEPLGLLDGSLFTSLPLALAALDPAVLDPAFSLPGSAWLSQGLMVIAGAGFLLAGSIRSLFSA
ncbi:MAG TPA: hypothetical protein IAC37_08565 [Candidatus Ventrimonas merdavium]|nr:hypothetical protein [Candidatus Ventrimonas merdavium]